VRKRLKKQDETQDSIKAKLKRGTFPATFLLACLAALELPALTLEDRRSVAGVLQPCVKVS
jgi:uncharacterized protein DUF6471